MIPNRSWFTTSKQYYVEEFHEEVVEILMLRILRRIAGENPVHSVLGSGGGERGRQAKKKNTHTYAHKQTNQQTNKQTNKQTNSGCLLLPPPSPCFCPFFGLPPPKRPPGLLPYHLLLTSPFGDLTAIPADIPGYTTSYLIHIYIYTYTLQSGTCNMQHIAANI